MVSAKEEIEYMIFYPLQLRLTTVYHDCVEPGVRWGGVYGGEDQLLVPLHWPLLQNHGGIRHGLHRRKIRLIEGNAKCRHLKKLTSTAGVIRVCRLEIANFLCTFSHVGIFNPALGSVLSCIAPLPFSLVPLFSSYIGSQSVSFSEFIDWR